MKLPIKTATSLRKLTLALCLAIFASGITASPLSDARDAGLVKELPSGFVASTGEASNETAKLVKSINSKRQDAYQKIAKKNGISVKQVGQESYLKRHPQ